MIESIDDHTRFKKRTTRILGEACLAARDVGLVQFIETRKACSCGVGSNNAANRRQRVIPYK
jgi:hypothetical protein